MTIVYLNRPQMRLFISNSNIIDKDIIKLFSTDGGDEISTAQAYCSGFVIGNMFGTELKDKPVINKPEEFVRPNLGHFKL